MLNNIRTKAHASIVSVVGRDRLDYLVSNTMNVVNQTLDPFLWTYECKAKILAIKQETTDTKTFVLLPNQNFKKPLSGQHIDVTAKYGSGREKFTRSYSLSEIRENTVAITVKKKPNGVMSEWLHEKASIGMTLDISNPKGDFIYRNQKKLLFISAGTGITPCYSMLLGMKDLNKIPDIELYHRSKYSDDTIFKSKLNHTVSNGNTLSYSQNNQLNMVQVLPEDLDKIYPDIKDRHIYLCGPKGFMEKVIKLLNNIEYDFDLLTIEKFNSFDTSNNVKANSKDSINVYLTSKNISFVIPAGNKKSILEAAEEQGIALEHGCRAGMCGSCRTNLVSGEVSGNQVGNTIYPCTSYGLSKDIVLA
jgi:ferredoxin-NADP reductase